jgi:O-methyltransferase domain/Dimerisation domain
MLTRTPPVAALTRSATFPTATATTTTAAATKAPARRRGSLGLWLRRAVERLFFRRKVEAFYRVLGGYTFFQLMRSAVELDLFTALSRRPGMTHEELKVALALEDRAARVLLLGCTVLGLIKVRRGRYRNSLVAARHLSRDSATNIVSMVEWQHAINYRPMFHLADALRANHNAGLAGIDGPGGTLFEKLAHHPELEGIFHRAMDEQSDNLAKTFVEQVDFSRYRQVADVGGGNAAYLIAIANAHPQLSGAVVDLPSVCALATANIERAGLSARLRTHPGDCFADGLPRDVDCFLFAHFLTLWSEQRNQQLLRDAYQALPAGGAVVIYNIMQEDARNGPLSSAIGSAYFLAIATGESMLWTWQEYCDWLTAAGFQKIERRRLLRDHGVIVATK